MFAACVKENPSRAKMREPSGNPGASTLRPSAFAAMVEGGFAFPAELYGVISGCAWLGGVVNLTIEVRTAYKRKSSLRVRDIGKFEIFAKKEKGESGASRGEFQSIGAEICRF